jgi:hypothetical protein
MDGLARYSRFGQQRTKPDSHPFFLKFFLYIPHYFRNDGRRRCRRDLLTARWSDVPVRANGLGARNQEIFFSAENQNYFSHVSDSDRKTYERTHEQTWI